MLGTCVHFLSQMRSHLSNWEPPISHFVHRISSPNLSLSHCWSIIPRIVLQPTQEMPLFSLWQPSSSLQPIRKNAASQRKNLPGTWRPDKVCHYFLKPRWLQIALQSEELNEPLPLSLEVTALLKTANFMGEGSITRGRMILESGWGAGGRCVGPASGLRVSN